MAAEPASLGQLVLGNTAVYAQVLRFFIVLFLGIVVTRTVLMPLARRVATRRDARKKTVHSLENLVGVIGFFMAFTVGLQAAEFGNLVTVIGTVAGAATVAVGWGMRDHVGSLVSGIFLHVYPSFVKEDYITVGETSGVVKEITLVETRLQGPNGKKIVLPNNYLTTQPITNHTKGRVTQDGFTVNVRPAKLEAATTALKQIALEEDAVLNTPEPIVQYMELVDGTIATELIYHVRDSEDVNAVKSTVIERFNTAAVEQELLDAPADDR